jgi:hypothetical protein
MGYAYGHIQYMVVAYLELVDVVFLLMSLCNIWLLRIMLTMICR